MIENGESSSKRRIRTEQQNTLASGEQVQTPNEATEALLNSNKKIEDDKSTERRNPNNNHQQSNKRDGKRHAHTTQPSADYQQNQFEGANELGEEDEGDESPGQREYDPDSGPGPNGPPLGQEGDGERGNDEDQEDEEEMQATDQEIQEGV